MFIFWGAAWYRSVFYCSVGLLVIAFAWVPRRSSGVRTNRRRAMNCYTHGNRPAVGICAICQKAISS